MLLFVFDGLLLLRFAERQLLPLLFQLPPRFTRFEPFMPQPCRLPSQAECVGVLEVREAARLGARQEPLPRQRERA